MITVDEALDIIESQVRDFGTESISLENGIGRVLREPIYADRDFPPYDRVTMDGIAILYSTFEKGQKQFEIEGVMAAGDIQKELLDPKKCLEVMTGASLPKGVDTVIPYEMINIKDGVATLEVDALKFRQNVHFKGLDRKEGEQVIAPGIRLSSSEVGVCATVGKAEILVSKLPRTLVLSSGDELVDIQDSPLPHQIRKSNVYRLTTVLKHYNIDVVQAHLKDDLETIKEKLKAYVEEYDLIIISGGVSKGKFDYLPQAMDEIGVEKLFHRIKQRPGKPFWFGHYGSSCTVFAFPGNPVSSFMCMQRYFKPWLDHSLRAQSIGTPHAKLTHDVHFEPDLTYFLEVKLGFNENGEILATPSKGNGSGDFANLVEADAFIQLPRGRNDFLEGEVFPIFVYRESGL